jgi:D-3-phosphoglycerate dehydrogenase
MKKGVRLVNTARGGVIDENALLLALEEGKVAAAALDVYENEPNPMPALLSHPRIACTPHIGAATLEAQDRIGEELADLIIEFAKNH